MSEFDDERLQGSLRAFLRAVDALAGAAGDGDEKAMLEAADAKRLSELVLRRHLVAVGWQPPAVEASAAQDEGVRGAPRPRGR